MAEVIYARGHTIEVHSRIDTSPAGRVLRGAIDSHLHFGPDIMPRRFNALEIALQAREVGMRAIVIKNHSYPTANLATLVGELVPEVGVYGGVCMEYDVGGLNWHAVEVEARLGGKVVWMPVFSSKNSINMVRKVLGIDMKGEGISIVNAKGKLVPEAIEILEVIKEHDMALATGHISAPEIVALVDKAKQMGLTKIAVTHAVSDFLSESILTPEQRVELAKEGVLIEYCAWQVSPTGGKTRPEDIVASIKREGARNCVISTDSGGVPHPTMPELLRMFIASLLRNGLTEEEVNYMVKINPAKLLGLKPQ
jgi:hypothetical protein